MAEHTLKTWPKPFEAVWEDKKRFEFRQNDRDFKVGDRLVLREWVPIHEEPCDWVSSHRVLAGIAVVPNPEAYCRICKRKKKMSLPGEYTGRWVEVSVLYMMEPPAFGLQKGFVVMSTEIIAKGSEPG